MGFGTAKAFTLSTFEDAVATVRGGPPAASFSIAPTPQELNAVYSRGYRGLRPETTTPEQKNQFRSMMGAMPKLYEMFPWAKDFGKGKVNCPFTAILTKYPEWGGQDAQERGDCTVHGTYNAGAIDYANDVLFGETEWKGPLACENIYRSRGSNGDGWSCEAPCMYVGPDGKGGFLYRQVWTNGSESVDLSKYNSSWSGNGRAGVPAWMETESQKCKVRWVVPIGTMPEHRDAIAIGFGINVCSGQGFSNSTDQYGYARAQGSWSHSMAHTANIDTEWAHKQFGDMLPGVQQSWGPWNTINGKPEGAPKSPVGMFYAKASVVASMISGQDSFALCGVWGWNRTNWEGFTIADRPQEYRQALLAHFKDSTVSDYYITRAERIHAHIEKSVDEGAFSLGM